MNLERYTTGGFSPGASLQKQILWWFIGQPILASYFLPFSWLKIRILALFGAEIGTGVRIKPGVRVRFPWRLSVGSHSWIGERVWIDNLAWVTIGSNCCLSQGAYLCTGNHRWDLPTFDLETREIVAMNHSWIGAKAVVGPGALISEGSVVSLGSVVCGRLEPWSIYGGNPATLIRERQRV